MFETKDGITQSVQRRPKGWTTGVRFPAETEDFSFTPQHPDRLRGPPSFQSKRYQGLFPGDKAVGV
jgi:hypothetical protein